MKLIKYLFILTTAVTFTSCLKERADIGGLLADEGTILTSTQEGQYISVDRTSPNTQYGWQNANVNVNFTARPTEAVHFFSIVVSQPRSKKITGPLTINVATAAFDGDLANAQPYGFGPTVLPIPTGAINIAPIVIPQSDASLITVPVSFTLNKALFVTPGINQVYGVKFSLSSASQGVISANDNAINVVFNYSEMNTATANQGTGNITTVNNSDIQGLYNYHSEFRDPLNQFTITDNAKRFVEQLNATTLGYVDNLRYATNGTREERLITYNTATGAQTYLFAPRFTIDATGKVTAVAPLTASASFTNFALDPAGENKITYTDNFNRKLSVKYTFTLTTAISGVNQPRTVTVFEEFTYNNNQIYF